MFCDNCGKELRIGAKFCPVCGEKVYESYSSQVKVDKPKVKPLSENCTEQNILPEIGSSITNFKCTFVPKEEAPEIMRVDPQAVETEFVDEYGVDVKLNSNSWSYKSGAVNSAHLDEAVHSEHFEPIFSFKRTGRNIIFRIFLIVIILSVAAIIVAICFNSIGEQNDDECDEIIQDDEIMQDISYNTQINERNIDFLI